MKLFSLFCICCLMCFHNFLFSQTGSWAKYDNKMKGDALVRESDGGYLNEVKSIVAGGGNVNWQLELTGLTPLLAASGGGHLEVVKFLLDNGAVLDLKNNAGKTALDIAKQRENKTVYEYLLKEKNKNTVVKSPVVIPPGKPNTIIIETPDKKIISEQVPAVSKKGTSAWASFGSLRVGEKVQFFNGKWNLGTVMEVGIIRANAAKNVVPTEKEYMIGREGAPNWNDWTDWGKVTGLTREKYWTDFFTGKWELGETMAVNTRTDGVNQRDEYTFSGATEQLIVQADNTYKWRTIDKKIIAGKWKAADDGAGIVLQNGFQQLNWTIRNETNAAEENIRGIESARLTTDGKMSIKAERRL